MVRYIDDNIYSIDNFFITEGPQCECGNRDWFKQDSETWLCSFCGKTQKVIAQGYILDGPMCMCGYRDWFVGREIVRCSHCSRKRFVKMNAYILDGPFCKCGNRDWFVSDDVYVCSNCSRILIKTGDV